jgi:hypothetical protein
MTGLTATMTALYITNKTEKQDSPTGVKSDINFYLSGNVTYFTFDLPSIVSVFPRRSITFIEVRNQITTQDLGFVLTYGASRGLGSDITYDLVGNQTINVSYANFKYYVPSRGSNYALNSAYGMKFTCFILDSIEPNNNYLF